MTTAAPTTRRTLTIVALDISLVCTNTALFRRTTSENPSANLDYTLLQAKCHLTRMFASQSPQVKRFGSAANSLLEASSFQVGSVWLPQKQNRNAHRSGRGIPREICSVTARMRPAPVPLLRGESNILILRNPRRGDNFKPVDIPSPGTPAVPRLSL